MPHREIPRRYRLIPASLLVEAVGNSLAAIKKADELSDPDLGAALGKGEDAARAYRTGFQTMDFVTFLRACQSWNGRFANDALAKIGMKLVDLDSGGEVGQETVTKLTRLVADLSAALENGAVDDARLTAMAGVVDEAGRAIDAIRERLGSAAVRR